MLNETKALKDRPRLRRLLQIGAVVAGLFGVGGVGLVVTSGPAGAGPAVAAGAGPAVAADAGPAISGKTEVPAHGLVKLKAERLTPGAAVLWRVSPRAGVDRATTAADRFEFAAPPGAYEIELVVIGKSGESLSVEEVTARVTVGEKKPDPRPDPKPDRAADPVAALGKVRFGNSSCTATVVGPRRPDGRWDVLTASHCLTGVGSRGTLALKDGRSLAVRAVVHDKAPDLCWLVTEDAAAELPFAVLAAANPAAGVKVWHQGYGTDRPGNREEGEVRQPQNADGRTQFFLSVSPGDSGGGIFRGDTNELVSTVCCTAGLARPAAMWGASAEAVRKARPGPVDLAALPDPDAPGGCR